MSEKWILKSGFELVFAARRGVSAGYLAVRWDVAPGQQTRIGISVARRVGGAVERNRVKRRLRAAVRALLKHMKAGYKVVVVAREGAARASYGDLEAKLQELLRRAGILSGEGEMGCAEGTWCPRTDLAH